MALPDFFKGVVDRGLTAVDLLNEEQWTVAKNEFGLICSMAYVGAGGINEGLNNPKHHETLINAMKTGLPKLKAAGFPNAICFFGKRDGMSDYDGIKNSIACLKQIKPIAEDNGVNVIIELLNSKVNHPDYIGDNTPYGAAIVARDRLAEHQAALRHLPHADHGGRCHRDDQQVQGPDRPLSHRRRARAATSSTRRRS